MRSDRPRIVGLETEYGCLVEEGVDAFKVIGDVRDWVFEKNRYGLIDLHHRGWDEPPGNGGFLYNGGRVYVDMGHLEYCTPECATVVEALNYDRAGDHLLVQALTDLGLRDSVSFIRNNIDHYTGATFGCHENYLLDRCAPLNENSVLSLVAFLTLRAVFTGSGRVGRVDTFWRQGEAMETVTGDCFQVTQRGDHVENDIFRWVQGNRAIINTRDEPLADVLKYRRLHLLHGDTNVLPAAFVLKVGATRMMLDLLENDALPRVELRDAVATLQAISRSPQAPWLVDMADGTRADAVELLHVYQEVAARSFGGRDAETDGILALWHHVLDLLASDDFSGLVGMIDWVTKKHLLDRFCASEELGFGDPWVQAQDLEYHNIDPRKGLGLALARDMDGFPSLTGVLEKSFLHDAPMATRASLRRRAMKDLGDSPRDYEIDWDLVRVGEDVCREFNEPFSQ